MGCPAEHIRGFHLTSYGRNIDKVLNNDGGETLDDGIKSRGCLKDDMFSFGLEERIMEAVFLGGTEGVKPYQMRQRCVPLGSLVLGMGGET